MTWHDLIVGEDGHPSPAVACASRQTESSNANESLRSEGRTKAEPPYEYFECILRKWHASFMNLYAWKVGGSGIGNSPERLAAAVSGRELRLSTYQTHDWSELK